MKKRVLEKIHLNFPNNEEYIHIARLAVSGIANKMNFDFDNIEKIKYALSEILKFAAQNCHTKRLDLDFDVCQDRLIMIFKKCHGDKSCSRKEIEKFLIRQSVDLYVDKFKIGQDLTLEKHLD